MIAYSLVLGASVYLNGIPISWWKADNQGYFVAKFQMTDVKELVETLVADEVLTLPAQMHLTLTGVVRDGTEFTGTQTITVIDVVPTGTGKK
jgi:hypothetical protein